MSTLRTTNIIHGSSAVSNLVLDNQGRAIFGPDGPQGRAALYVNAQNNRVGVNTETPAVALDVAGAINATGNVAIGGTLSVTGNVDFNGTIDADNEFLTVGGMQIRRNMTPTSGAGIELFRSSSGFGQIQSYDRDGNALIGLYINSENWKILQTGQADFGEASNSTNNNGVLIGGHNGSLNVYTTRYSTDCFQIINTSGSGNNIAHQFFGNGTVNLAGGDLRIEQITGDTSNSVRITTDPSSSGSGSKLVFNMDASQNAVTIYNSGLRVGGGGVEDRIQLDGSAGGGIFSDTVTSGSRDFTAAYTYIGPGGIGVMANSSTPRAVIANDGSARFDSNVIVGQAPGSSGNRTSIAPDGTIQGVQSGSGTWIINGNGTADFGNGSNIGWQKASQTNVISVSSFTNALCNIDTVAGEPAFVTVYIRVFYAANSALNGLFAYNLLTVDPGGVGAGDSIQETVNDSVGDFQVSTSNFAVTYSAQSGSVGRITITYTNTGPETNRFQVFVTGKFNSLT